MLIGFGLGAVVLSLLLLPRIKGGLIGFQWARRMHGFGTRGDLRFQLFDARRQLFQFARVLVAELAFRRRGSGFRGRGPG